MTFNRDALLQALNALTEDADSPRRYVIGFSGGLDSTVLLHALAETAAEHKTPLLAVHVDHGMQSESAGWAEQCRVTAEQYGVEFRSQRVAVDLGSGKGPEAAARTARYAALCQLMSPGDWLLSAHHEDDQAETLLLNLLRGSGPAGLAGIAAIRRLEPGWLARPLLAFPRAALEQYAAKHGLSWIEDPSNAERILDRNYLRHEVLPLLEVRWPGASQRLNRSSRIAADAAGLLDDLAKANQSSPKVSDGHAILAI